MERVGAELARLVRARIRTVIIPGTHDVYDGSSVYRAHDLKALSGSTPDDDYLTVLTPERPEVLFAPCDALVVASVFDTKRAPHSPLRNFRLAGDPRATWKIGVVHGALAISGKTDGDDVVFTKDEIASSGLDYLALGHWHSRQSGKAGPVTYAYSGAPEPVAVAEMSAATFRVVHERPVLGRPLVEADERPGAPWVVVIGHDVWQSRFGSDPNVIGRELRLGADSRSSGGIRVRLHGARSSAERLAR